MKENRRLKTVDRVSETIKHVGNPDGTDRYSAWYDWLAAGNKKKLYIKKSMHTGKSDRNIPRKEKPIRINVGNQVVKNVDKFRYFETDRLHPGN